MLKGSIWCAFIRGLMPPSSHRTLNQFLAGSGWRLFAARQLLQIQKQKGQSLGLPFRSIQEAGIRELKQISAYSPCSASPLHLAPSQPPQQSAHHYDPQFEQITGTVSAQIFLHFLGGARQWQLPSVQFFYRTSDVELFSDGKHSSTEQPWLNAQQPGCLHVGGLV